MYLKDNKQNQKISELHTDDKTTKYMMITIFLNQLKTFMKNVIPRDNLQNCYFWTFQENS